jgi:hypothetical protein
LTAAVRDLSARACLAASEIASSWLHNAADFNVKNASVEDVRSVHTTLFYSCEHTLQTAIHEQHNVLISRCTRVIHGNAVDSIRVSLSKQLCSAPYGHHPLTTSITRHSSAASQLHAHHPLSSSLTRHSSAASQHRGHRPLSSSITRRSSAASQRRGDQSDRGL